MWPATPKLATCQHPSGGLAVDHRAVVTLAPRPPIRLGIDYPEGGLSRVTTAFSPCPAEALRRIPSAPESVIEPAS